VAPANYLDWKEQSQSFEQMAGYDSWLDELALSAFDGEPVIVRASTVTGTFFDVLGVSPLHGRVFEETETWAGSEPSVVLSYGLWMRKFGGDPRAVGRSITLDGRPFRVIGILPSGFRFPYRDAELWRTVAWKPEVQAEVSFRRAHSMYVLGRLAKGVALADAEAELAGIAARLAAQYPETNRYMESGATGLHEWIVGDTRRPLQILLAAVVFVFLIASINVANMMLARDAGRGDEVRIRLALGGSRSRILSQGLAEGLILGILSGAIGLTLGLAVIDPILAMSPDKLPRIDEVRPDSTVLAFALASSVAGALVVGFVSAWRMSGSERRGGLAPGSRSGGASKSGRRTTAALVALEVALSLPLVIGAGLMTRTLWALTRVEPGFAPENVLVAQLSLPEPRYENDGVRSTLIETFVRSAGEIAGVESAAATRNPPLGGGSGWSSDFTCEGWPPDRFGIDVQHDDASPGLFRTLRVPLLRGREFEWSDAGEAPRVVIVNQALAERYFPGEDPIGKRIAFDRVPDADSTWREIVGVVGNVRDQTLALEEEPTIYAPVLQGDDLSYFLLVRSEIPPGQLREALQARLHALDPELPLYDVTTLVETVSSAVARERFLLALLAASALVALLLAAVGIGGVVSQSTARRVREIGIRMALGAQRRGVVGLMIRDGMRPVAFGIAAGLLASTVLARGMSSLLFSVEPLDPLTYLLVSGFMAGAAVLACFLPARAAASVDASRTLRSE
jgi:putative ABC transport system permease protein